MNPNDQPWTPKPYQPQQSNNTPTEPTQTPVEKPAAPAPAPELQVPSRDEGEFVWQRPHDAPHHPTDQPHRPIMRPTGEAMLEPEKPAAPVIPAMPEIPHAFGTGDADLDLPEVARAPHQPSPERFFQPHVSATPEVQAPIPSTQWGNPQAPHGTQPLGPTQQFGGQMAELPAVAPSSLTSADKKQRKIFWIIVAALVILPALGIGAYLGLKLNHDSNQQKIAQQQKISYNLSELQAVAKSPLTDATVANLDKEKTLLTVMKQAALKQIVQTKWGVYYTAQQADQRGDQYSLYDTAINYQDKKYSYNENAYSNLGVYQVRCIGADQYNYNDSKLTTSPSWQPASDSTDCKLNTVTMHLNDGMNTGGLTDKQADAFLTKLQKSGVITVNSVALTTNRDKQYIKVDFNVVPQKQGSLYQGMQIFMNAFQATGLDAAKHPYTFFGAGGEGTHVQYYIDPATLLPAYARMDSTPVLGSTGQPQLTTNWSHRTIEYSFPDAVADQNLDSHTPITFTAWPDH